jgi:hypothetical protein
MKTKHLFLALAALIALGGLWFGRAAWRAHRQIVTLHVRNAPLSDVLRKIERQTWRKIRAEKALDARITLNVTDAPLAYVLDSIGEQAGARWTTLHAVYGSANALRSLDTALRGDGKLEPAGWTKLAPISPPAELQEGDGPVIRLRNPGPDGSPTPGENGRVIIRRTPNGQVAIQNDDRDVKLGSPDQQGANVQMRVTAGAGGSGGPMIMRRIGNGPMVFQNANGLVEVWSPEELLLESALQGRIQSPSESADDTLTAGHKTADAAAAAKTAQAVKGKCADFIALRKSLMGIGFSALPKGRPGPDALRQAQYERFARLTPEQRVQRARQRLALAQQSTNQPPQ